MLHVEQRPLPQKKRPGPESVGLPYLRPKIVIALRAVFSERGNCAVTSSRHLIRSCMPRETFGTQAQNPATPTSGRICRAAEPTSTTDWLSYFINCGVLNQDPQAKITKEQRRKQSTQRSRFFFCRPPPPPAPPGSTKPYFLRARGNQPFYSRASTSDFRERFLLPTPWMRTVCTYP